MSAYYLEHASVDHIQKHFDFFEEEARSLLASGLAIPAYVYYCFNLFIVLIFFPYLFSFQVNIFLNNMLGMTSF